MTGGWGRGVLSALCGVGRRAAQARLVAARSSLLWLCPCSCADTPRAQHEARYSRQTGVWTREVGGVDPARSFTQSQLARWQAAQLEAVQR